MGCLSVIMFYMGAPAEQSATPSGKNWYTGPVLGLISIQFEHFYSGPTPISVITNQRMLIKTTVSFSFKLSLLICSGTCRSSCFCKTETDLLLVYVASAALAAMCCGLSLDSDTMSQCEKATHTYIRTCILSPAAVSEHNAGKKKRAALLWLLAAFLLSEWWPTFSPGKKGLCSRLWECVRVGRKWREGEKVKAEEWEKQKDHVQEEIDRVSEKTELAEWLLWCKWVNIQAPMAHFFWTRSGHNKKSTTTVFTFLCGFGRCLWWMFAGVIILGFNKEQ